MNIYRLGESQNDLWKNNWLKIWNLSPIINIEMCNIGKSDVCSLHTARKCTMSAEVWLLSMKAPQSRGLTLVTLMF